MAQFGDRLVQAVRRTNTPTLVGIDPRLANLPDPIRPSVSAPAAEQIAEAVSYTHLTLPTNREV